MARRRNPQSDLDREIEREYYRIGSGVKIDILSIPKIFADARRAHAAGIPVAEALPAILERYRVGGEPVRR